MPVNNDLEEKVILFCSECEGEGEECSECKGTGIRKMTVEDWMRKNVTDNAVGDGVYTYSDMVKAYRLGTLAESGNFPPRDYFGAENVINKYFKPIE